VSFSARRINFVLVGRLLHRLGFGLQANRKTREGAAHPDHNAQFEYINAGRLVTCGDSAIVCCSCRRNRARSLSQGAGAGWAPEKEWRDLKLP
jgi:hypothetical protein